MQTIKRSLLLINILGGLAVLGSYAWGFMAYPNAGQVLWGGVPADLRSLYTASMFLAAAGYFAFSIFILQLDPQKTTLLNRNGFKFINPLYAGILIPSAFWLPLTILAIEVGRQPLAWLVKLDLTLVAIASLGLVFALINIRPRRPGWLHGLGLLGSVLFCFQTVILDAIVWSIHFHL